jgi:hypothetical protein
MLKARPGRQNPLLSPGEKPVGVIGSRSVDRIKGSGHVRRKSRTHDRTPPRSSRLKKRLRPGSHPHMTPRGVRILREVKRTGRRGSSAAMTTTANATRDCFARSFSGVATRISYFKSDALDRRPKPPWGAGQAAMVLSPRKCWSSPASTSRTHMSGSRLACFAR